MSKLVSIIVPVYNAEAYIEKCIKSILSQSYNNIELILVNDGSLDNSGSICEEFASRDNRVKIIHQKNMGPSEARNTGIKASNGSFLQFVDADDQIDKYMTECLYSTITNEDYQVDLVISGFKSRFYFYDKYIERVANSDIEGYYTLVEFMGIFADLFNKHLINSPCNKLYVADIIKSNNIKFVKDIHNGEDLLFNIEYLKRCNNIAVLNKAYYNYVHFNNPNSLTKDYKKNFLENRKLIYNELKNFLEEYSIDVSQNEKFLRELFSSYLIQVLSNVFHANAKLSFKMKKTEIEMILKDIWISENLSIMSVKTFQEKVIKLLANKNSFLGIILYFDIKKFIKKYLKFVFNFLKKIN